MLAHAGAVLVAAAMLLAGSDAGAQGARIAFVNTQRIESESATVAREMAALKEEIARRGKPLQELQQRIAAAQERYEREKGTLPAAKLQAMEREIGDMMRRSNQMVESLSEDYELRRNEIRAKIVRQALAAIKVVAEAGKYDLVVQEAAFARATVDITDRVLKEMARQSGAAR